MKFYTGLYSNYVAWKVLGNINKYIGTNSKIHCYISNEIKVWQKWSKDFQDYAVLIAMKVY